MSFGRRKEEQGLEKCDLFSQSASTDYSKNNRLGR